jgi:Arc/MetJ family transcription regulator
MSRTNIDIDNALIADVMRKTGAKTEREAVDLGLKTLLRLRNRADIRTLRGKLSWTGDLDAMRLDK